MGEHKEELERLGNATDHRCDDGGRKNGFEAGSTFGLGGGIECRRDSGQAKELDPAGGGKAGPGSELVEGARAMGEDGKQVGPRGVDAFVYDQVVVVDGHVEQMMQADGFEGALQKHKETHAWGTDSRKCMAQRIGRSIYKGNSDCRDDGEAENSEKADQIDQRRAGERAKPIGHLGIVEAVMDSNDDCRNRQRSDDAGVEGLNTVDNGDTGGGGQ